jgi:dipeptidyl aminopeptidase/acylaminoacyl peptidase
MKKLAVLLVVGSLFTTVSTWAQGTRADYARAAQMRELMSGKVFRETIKPEWLAGGQQFWYQVQTGSNTHEFILVDAAQARRQPAFDHARLASALRQAGERDVQPQRLGLDKLEFPDASRFFFRRRGIWWSCQLPAYTVEHLSRTNPPVILRSAEQLPRASRRTGPETSLSFVNRTAAEVELIWLDTEGQRQSYGKLKPGEQRRQHTFEGHVWLVLDAQGKTLAGFEADGEAQVLEVDGKATPVPDNAVRPTGNRRSKPGLSPDGQWQTHVENFNLQLRQLASNTSFALTRDGTAEDGYGDRVYWSPDSKYVAAIRTRKGDDRKVYLVESSPKDQLQPRLHTLDYTKPGDRLAVDRPQIFEASTRRLLGFKDDLYANPFSMQNYQWEKDSRRFTFLYNQRGHQALRWLALDVATGEVKPIIEETSPTFIDYSGKHLLHPLPDTEEAIWMSERDGWNHLYLYDTRGGRVKQQITRGEWLVRGVDWIDEKKRQIWFRAGGIRPGQDPYHVHYARVNFDGSGLVILTEGDGQHRVQFSPDRTWFIDTWSRVDLPPVNELRRSNDGALVCKLEQADWSALLKTGWLPPERFVAKARDGVTDIHGIIIRPLNFNPRRKYPVIEDIYAGPHSAFVPKEFRSFYSSMPLAELGFVIVKMDGMGTSQRSKKFHDVCWQNIGDAGFPDRIAWIKAAARKYPALDLQRVGIYGGSAGGQNSTRALLAHGEFYKVGVSDCGCHDNRMDKIWWNEQWMGWPIGPHYAEQSNVTQAHKLTGKLLLIVGELDRNVDPASTLQVVNALIKADKDFDLLVVPGGGHGIAESPYGQRRRMDFFVRHLLGVEARSKP